MGKVGLRKASLDRTHQLDNPLDKGFWHIVPCGQVHCLMPVLYSEHGSHTNVAGVISLAKLTKSGRINMPLPVRVSAQG